MRDQELDFQMLSSLLQAVQARAFTTLTSFVESGASDPTNLIFSPHFPVVWLWFSAVVFLMCSRKLFLHVMSCHVMSCHAMHVMSCHAMPCHAMPCHAMSCHVRHQGFPFFFFSSSSGCESTLSSRLIYLVLSALRWSLT